MFLYMINKEQVVHLVRCVPCSPQESVTDADLQLLEIGAIPLYLRPCCPGELS